MAGGGRVCTESVAGGGGGHTRYSQYQNLQVFSRGERQDTIDVRIP